MLKRTPAPILWIVGSGVVCLIAIAVVMALTDEGCPSYEEAAFVGSVNGHLHELDELWESDLLPLADQASDDLTLLQDPAWKSKMIPTLEAIYELGSRVAQVSAPTEKTQPVHDEAVSLAGIIELMVLAYFRAMEPEHVDEGMEIAVWALAAAIESREDVSESMSAVCY